MKPYFSAFLCIISLTFFYTVEAKNFHNNEIICNIESSTETSNCETIYHEFWDTGCYMYSWNSEVYTNSGNYTQRFTASNGCDSIVTLHLTMYVPAEYEYYISVCGSYTRNGVTYTESGTYHQPFYTPGKCDSIVTLHITIKPIHNVQIYDYVCKDHIYQNYGFYVNSVGQQSPIIRTRTVTSSLGCDSIVTLNLTITNPEYHQRGIIACGQYIWEGITYDVSGSYTRVFQNTNGCDSIVTLNLTILSVSYGETSAAACESYTWYGKTYYESGDYQHALSNSIGCDSIVTLHLTIHEPYNLEIHDEICKGGIYNQYGFNIPTADLSGLITETIDLGSTIHNCDSTKTLYLTVHERYNDTVDIVSCGPYTWNNHIYPVSGYYRQFFTDQYECDSIVTINLTVGRNWEMDEYIESCGPTYYQGYYYIQSGIFQKYFKSIYGCDSIVNLHVTIYPQIQYYNYDTTACGNPFYWGGGVYTEPGTYTNTFVNSHGCDSVVTLNILGFQDFAYGEFDETTCGSYTWRGITYTASGDYSQAISRPGLCDSLVTLHLTILEEYYKVVNAEDCISFTYNGETYTESGQYFQSFINHLGCDSVYEINVIIYPEYDIVLYDNACRGEIYDKYGFVINTSNLSGVISRTLHLESIHDCDSTVTLYLNVLPIYHMDIFDSVCKGEIYNKHGFTINTANLNGTIIENLTLQTINNCDSVLALHLTIHPVYNITLSESGCDSVVWNGQVYTQSGSYSQNFITKYGCDSIVTKNITINKPTSRNLYEEACDFFSWFGVTYSSSGIYEYTTTGANGCDSVLILNLTIYPVYDVSETVHSCGPYTWNGQTYSQSGIYSRTFSSHNGCDSIVKKEIFIHYTQSTYNQHVSCGPYIWEGDIYTQSGIYIKPFKDIYGCDSISTLDLTVISSPGVGVIVGPSNVAIAEGSQNEVFEYTVTGVDNAKEYIWKVSNEYWVVVPNGKKCRLFVTTPGSAVLSVKAVGECIGDPAELNINAVFGINDYVDDNISIYPNPADDIVNIKFEGLEGKVNIKITDYAGKLIDNFNVFIDSNNTIIPYSVNNFSKGLYLFVISDEKNSFVNKIIIK
jgi:hypothetical protein